MVSIYKEIPRFPGNFFQLHFLKLHSLNNIIYEDFLSSKIIIARYSHGSGKQRNQIERIR